MNRIHTAQKGVRGRQGSRPASPAPPPFSPQAVEVRALLRRVPDGLKAALNYLAEKPVADRERVMSELARALGKEILPMVRSAALSKNEDLALSALRVLPVFGTRAAGDVLVEAYKAHPEGDRAHWARMGAQALQARGVNVSVPGDELAISAPRLTLRDTCVSAPDGAGSRSVAARFQDNYGVWHAVFVLWNDQAGVKDGFKRPVSRHEWQERLQKEDEGVPLWVSCPADYARWVVSQARSINAQTGFPLENHLDEWDRLMGPPPDDYEPQDVGTLAAELSPEARDEALASSRELLKTADADRWLFEVADVITWAQAWIDVQNRYRLRKAENEDWVLPEFQGVARSALQEHFTPEIQQLYRGRLVDLALVSLCRHQQESANRALAVISALDAGVEAAEIPLFMGLMQRTLLTGEVVIRRGEDPERMRYRPMKRY